MSLHHRCGFSAFLWLLLALSTLHAQSTKVELFGVVRDPGGLPVSGATVELINMGTGNKLSATSDLSGAYHFSALPAGSYRIDITKDGFSALRRDGIVVRVGDRIPLDLDLAVGDVSQSVEITAAAPARAVEP